MQQNNCHSSHLGQGVGLAEDAWFEFPSADRCIENRRHHQDSHIPAENQRRDTGGDQSLVHEHQKESAEQQLVGYRVEVLSQDSSLLQHPGYGAIQRIGQPCRHKEAEAQRIVVFKNGGHQKGARQMRNSVSRLGAVRNGLNRVFETSFIA